MTSQLVCAKCGEEISFSSHTKNSDGDHFHITCTEARGPYGRPPKQLSEWQDLIEHQIEALRQRLSALIRMQASDELDNERLRGITGDPASYRERGLFDSSELQQRLEEAQREHQVRRRNERARQFLEDYHYGQVPMTDFFSDGSDISYEPEYREFDPDIQIVDDPIAEDADATENNADSDSPIFDSNIFQSDNPHLNSEES